MSVDGSQDETTICEREITDRRNTLWAETDIPVLFQRGSAFVVVSLSIRKDAWFKCQLEERQLNPSRTSIDYCLHRNQFVRL